MDPISLVIALAVLVLWIVTLVNISNCPMGSAANLTLWALIATLFPIAGPIMWYAMGKKILSSRA